MDLKYSLDSLIKKAYLHIPFPTKSKIVNAEHTFCIKVIVNVLLIGTDLPLVLHITS